jgi:integrase
MTSEALIPRTGGTEIETFIERILDGVQSVNTRRGYRRSILAFVQFISERREPLSKALMNEFKAGMRVEGRGAAAINQALSAVRFFLREAAIDGRLDPVEVERACKVAGVVTRGRREGNWLTRDQAEKILAAPDTTTALGLRDRAILALLIGAGLRRAECAALTVEHFQQREGRWCIVDICGKRNKLRTVPIASWVKALVDSWTTAAGITSGLICRRASWGLNKFEVSEKGLSEQGVYRVALRYGWQADAPLIRPHDLRRTFAKLARDGEAPLEQIQLSLGHESIATTERYLGSKLNYQDAAGDRLRLNVRV